MNPGFSLARPLPSPGRRALALSIVLAAQCMFAMDLLIVLVALPQIQHDLGFHAATLSWVLNGFGLAFGGLLLLGGRLGDMLGQVRAFRFGLAVFVVASLLGGVAQTPLLLVAARVLQGVGAALAGPSVLALVMAMARDPREQARGMSLFIAVSSVGASAGLILGGILTEYLSWRWALLINVPVGALVILTVGRLVPDTHPQPARLDVPGALTATLGSSALVYGFIRAAQDGWADAGTIIAFIGSACLFLAFTRIQRGHPAPLLHPDLLRHRGGVAALVVMALIVGMHFALLFLLVQYLQQVLGYQPLLAGVAYLPLTMTVFVISHFVPRLLARFGARSLLVTGSALVAISLAGFALLGEHSAYIPGVLLPLLIHAAGIALVFAPGTVAIMHGVPAEHAGAASGLLQMDQQVGGALGIAVVMAIYAAHADTARFATGLPAAFGGAAAIAALAALVSWRAVRAARD